MPHHRPRLLWWLVFGLVCGCATWEIPREQTSLPTPTMPIDSVRLEIEFVRIPVDFESRLGELWDHVDEQHFEPSVRRTLSANGLRCGLIKTQLPTIVRDLLATERPPLEQMAAGTDPETNEVFANFRELQSRSGRRYKVVAAPRMQDKLVLLINEQDRVRALEFSEAQGLFALRTHAMGDGRIRLELTPLVEHGAIRQRFVPGQAGFLLEAGRDSEAIDLLRIEAVLAPGETFLLAATPDAKGLGAWYFGGQGEAANRAVMLVRLAQTQYDDLFLDEPLTRPLTTPLE